MNGFCILALLRFRQHHLSVIQYIVRYYKAANRHLVKYQVIIQRIVQLVGINEYQVKLLRSTAE